MSFLNFTLPFLPTLALAALIPMILGFIYYNPKVMGGVWMSAIGKTQEELQKGFNPAIVFPVAYLMSFFLAFALTFAVIHQFHLFSMLQDCQAQLKDPNSHLSGVVADLMKGHGHSFRTFKHGALHGTLIALTFALPIIGAKTKCIKGMYLFFVENPRWGRVWGEVSEKWVKNEKAKFYHFITTCLLFKWRFNGVFGL